MVKNTRREPEFCSQHRIYVSAFCNSSSKQSSAFYGSLQEPGMHLVHIDMQESVHMCVCVYTIF